VVLSRALAMKRDDAAASSSIGSPVLHGVLSLAMAGALFTGLAIKFNAG
jgi:acyl dehydratase